MAVDGTQVKVDFHWIRSLIECPRCQNQNKGKVLEDDYLVVQDEGQVTVEQPTNGHMEDGILQIQSATP